MLIYVVVIFVLVVIYKIAKNGIYFYKLNKFQNIYYQYVRSESRADDKWKNLLQNVLENKHEIIDIIIALGLKDFGVQITKPTGFNHVEHKSVSVLNNLQTIEYINDINIPVTIEQYLAETKGIAKKRMIESINPFYWIDLIIFLPRSIATYIGLPLNNEKCQLIVKVLNVLYWMTVVLLPFIFKFFGIKLMILI